MSASMNMYLPYPCSIKLSSALLDLVDKPWLCLCLCVSGKRVLLVDFHSLHTAAGGNSRDDHSSDLRGLFRDADMNDAIIFFDECEAIFAQRERGGDRMLNSLLTEMERHEGIIMLATNRPLDLDEAMHRRITCVSEFHAPDHTQRRAIWKLASERLPVTDNIDWDRIALR
jgi:AAA+ superfamily predicted ATPase